MTAGEHWAREELLALRAAGFRLAAWWRFLSDSVRRARENRQARPELARQARAWSAAALIGGLTATRVLRRAGLAAPRPTAWTAWWLVTAVMLDWHLGMLEGPHGEHRDRLRAADAVTLARLGLVPFVAATGSHSQRDGAVFATLIAGGGVCDLLDGPLARRAGPTRLGRDLDAAADVLVGLTGARAARRAGWLSPGAARLATLRHALPVAVVTAAYFRTGRRLPRAAFGRNQWAANLVLGGLIASPANPPLASALTRFASLATLTAALGRRNAAATNENAISLAAATPA